MNQTISYSELLECDVYMNIIDLRQGLMATMCDDRGSLRFHNEEGLLEQIEISWGLGKSYH